MDGFHLDIKTPFWLLDSNSYDDRVLFDMVYGIKYNNELIRRMSRTMILIAHRKKEYDLTRTVKYPFAPEDYFDLIKESMSKLGIPYDINPFVDLDEF